MGSIKRTLTEAGYGILARMDPADKNLMRMIHDRSLLAVLTANRVDCVVDVGANRGDFVAFLREGGYTGRILSVEPNPELSAHLQQRSAQDAGWTVHSFALGNSAGRKPFHIMRNPHFSSFHEPSHAATSQFAGRNDVERTLEVEVRTLDTVMAVDDARSIFLKLDTQGYDLEVLTGGANTLARVSGIQTELSVVPIYQGMPSYIESLERMDGLGFRPVGFFPLSKQSNGAVIEFDCLLVRGQ